MKPCKNVLDKIITFTQNSESKTVGIAYCMFHDKEVKLIENYLKQKINVKLSPCDICRKIELGLENYFHIGKVYDLLDNACDSAKSFNKENTDFNIILGLCPEKRTRFLSKSKQMNVVLVVKHKTY